MDFDALVASLREPGEDGVDPSIYDDLSAAYRSQVDTADGAAAKVVEQNERIAAMEAEISRLKSMNFDLMVAGNANVETDAAEESASNDYDDSLSGVDSLFTNSEDE